MKRILYYIPLLFSSLLLSCEKGEGEKATSLIGTWQISKVEITTYHHSLKKEDTETISPEDYYIEFKDDGKALFFHSSSTKETTYEFNEVAHKLYIRDTFSIYYDSEKSVSIGSITYSNYTLSSKQLILLPEGFTYGGDTSYSWKFTLEKK